MITKKEVDIIRSKIQGYSSNLVYKEISFVFDQLYKIIELEKHGIFFDTIVNGAKEGLVSVIEWHKIKRLVPTEEDKKDYEALTGFPAENIKFLYGCDMPEDGQEILIATSDGVAVDICCTDEYGYELENQYNGWDDVLAWAPTPSYEGGK